MAKAVPSSEAERDASRLRSVTRVFDVLDAISATHDASALASVARRAHLHPATALRYLRSLEQRGYVRHDPNEGYRIGPRLFELGTMYADSLSIHRYADQIARDLSAATHETASVGVLDSGCILYVAIANGQHEFGIQSHAGTRHPAYCTALGKAILAFLPWDETSEVLAASPLTRLTPRTHVDIGDLRADLERTAVRGYAVDDEERLTGVVCIGAPIFDEAHRVAGAVSISGPKVRIHRRSWESFGRLVTDAASKGSRRLG